MEQKKFSDDIQNIRNKYTPGVRIQLGTLDDPCTSLKSGNIGIISHVDDLGQIHVLWENGSSLALVPGVDAFEIIE